MKANFYQRGEAIDYLNETEDKIEAGDIVVFGSHVGVAGTDIEPEGVGTLHVTGVFAMPKGGDAIDAGADVAYDEKEGTVSAADEGAIGYAVEAAAADDTTVKVKLLG